MAPRTIVKAALAAMVLSSVDTVRRQERASGEDMAASKMIGDVEPQALSTVQSAPWSHDKVGFSQATHTGKGVHIYVMDTGVRTTHSEFTGRAIRTFDYSSEGACTDGDTECAADNGGHGTLCAATAGGKQYGVATDAIIHAMKVCGNDGSCDIQKGLDWLVLNAEEPAVMTMSLGIEDKSETGKAAIDQIVDSGVTVFVSAGNSNLDSCTASWSWGFVSSTIAVGSVDEANKRSPWSNWGECNAIYAPGSNILSAHSASDSSSWTVSGTDMAAPLVAGSAALLLEANPSWAPAEIRSKLIDSAKKDVLSDMAPGDPNLLLDVSSF